MTAAGHQATVLIIATDPTARGAWARALERERHAVITAAAIDTAVGHAREGGIDAIVFDATDRDADGRALMQALDRLPEPPPLVLVSGSRRGPELSAHLGAAAFVPKPCDAEDIVGECQRLLASRTWRAPTED